MRQVLLVAVLALAACADTSVVATEVRPIAISEPLFKSLYSNIPQPRRLVIRDEESWAKLWAQMVAAGVVQNSPPVVDFEKEQIVVAAMGERKAAGYEITITGVERSGSNLVVDVASTAPAPTCDRSEVITTPLHAVRMTRTDEPIVFNETSVVLGC
jgi:hypothetical protein